MTECFWADVIQSAYWNLVVQRFAAPTFNKVPVPINKKQKKSMHVRLAQWHFESLARDFIARIG